MKISLHLFDSVQGLGMSEDVHYLMRNNSHEFYSTIKVPNSKSNKRHVSQREHLKEILT